MSLVYLTEENPKTIKGRKEGYMTLVLSMPPGDKAGKELCPYRTPECYKDCLGHSTHYARNYPAVVAAQLRRAHAYIKDPKAFVRQIRKDIDWGRKKAAKLGLILAVRLNKATDILWERTGVMSQNEDIIFYDYTKVPLAFRHRHAPPNYHLTFSYDGKNEGMCRAALKAGYNVAAIFAGEYPPEWWGFPTINGDANDLRFLDPTPSVVALTPKGTLKQNLDSIFVIKPEGILACQSQ